jgi:amino acid transporter
MTYIPFVYLIFEQFDKAILTLSSGGLGLSLTFIKDKAIYYHVTHMILLKCSWDFFTIAILSTILSFRTGVYSIDKAIREIKNPLEKDKKNIPAIVTTGLNWVSAVFFILGVIFTVVFVSKTVEESIMSKEPKETNSGQKEKHIKGVTPAPPPNIPSPAPPLQKSTKGTPKK